jgi:hypothetical protein
MPKPYRAGGLGPYEYWILWVLTDEGGTAELRPTIYQRVLENLTSNLVLGYFSYRVLVQLDPQ